MAKAKKYYAVKKGYKKGIFDTWEECEKNIYGYPGAVYKSFFTKEEAVDFLNGGAKKKKTSAPVNNILQAHTVTDNNTLKAYTCGWYYNNFAHYSYGIVLLTKGREVMLNGVGNDLDMVEMKAIAGEVLASMKAIEWAYNNGHRSIEVHYEQQGIESWATNDWNANKETTKAYVRFIEEYRSKMDISFVKAKRNKGGEYNRLANNLAKKAFSENIETIKKNNGKDLKNVDEELYVEFKEKPDDKVIARGQILISVLLGVDVPVKTEVSYEYAGYKITNKKMRDFVKKVSVYDGHHQKKIESSAITIDIKNEAIHWTINMIDGASYKYQLNLSEHLK